MYEELDRLDREREEIMRKSGEDDAKDREDARKDDKEAEAAEKVSWILVENIPNCAGERQW